MKHLTMAALAASTMLIAAPAMAQTVYNDLNLWQTAVGTSNLDTTYGAEWDALTGLTLDDGTPLTFSSTTEVRAIGSSWATWSNGYTGQILYSLGETSLTIGFGQPVSGFGFFIEPNPFDVRTFTLLLSNGSTIQGSYDGNAGAGFLGFAGSGITSVTVSSDVDFSLGQFYTAAAAVPEPGTWAMMILGFGMVGGAMRRRVTTKVSFAA